MMLSDKIWSVQEHVAWSLLAVSTIHDD